MRFWCVSPKAADTWAQLVRCERVEASNLLCYNKLGIQSGPPRGGPGNLPARKVPSRYTARM
jgi:hypothetical protein